jgi:uncharacterized protein
MMKNRTKWESQMKKTMKTIILSSIAAATFIGASSMAQTCCDNQNPSTLNINTSANLKQAPDIALVNAGIITKAKTAKLAMAENATKMSAAFAALKTAGIAEKDMQTSGINLNPEYVYQENKPPIIKGYQVSNSLNIKIRDMNKVGPVLDALVAQGINQISGPSFSVEDPDKAMDKARQEAIQKANERANLYAKGFGMKVKRVISISESGGYQSPMPQPVYAMKAMAMADAAAETSVAAGEVTLNLSLSVQFELEK